MSQKDLQNLEQQLDTSLKNIRNRKVKPIILMHISIVFLMFSIFHFLNKQSLSPCCVRTVFSNRTSSCMILFLSCNERLGLLTKSLLCFFTKTSQCVITWIILTTIYVVASQLKISRICRVFGPIDNLGFKKFNMFLDRRRKYENKTASWRKRWLLINALYCFSFIFWLWH